MPVAGKNLIGQKKDICLLFLFLLTPLGLKQTETTATQASSCFLIVIFKGVTRSAELQTAEH